MRQHEIWTVSRPESYVEARKQGYWSYKFGAWTSEGPYQNDQRHGRSVERWHGTVREGPYVLGQRERRRMVRDPFGNEEERHYLWGERHGRWVVRHRDGWVAETFYVDGTR